MTFTNRLREIATAQGITLAELSRRSGVSATMVYGCARGAVPGASVRQRIANALHIAPEEIWQATPTAARAHG